MGTNTNVNDRLPFKVKLCYSAGGFGKSLPTVMLMAYSLYFYSNSLIDF